MRLSRILSALLVLLLAAGMLVGCSGQNGGGYSPPAQESPPAEQPPTGDSGDAEGQQLVEAKCTRCHTIQRIDQAQKSEAEWLETVDRMIANGADVSEEEKAKISQYLAQQDAQ